MQEESSYVPASNSLLHMNDQIDKSTLRFLSYFQDDEELTSEENLAIPEKLRIIGLPPSLIMPSSFGIRETPMLSRRNTVHSPESSLYKETIVNLGVNHLPMNHFDPDEVEVSNTRWGGKSGDESPCQFSTLPRIQKKRMGTTESNASVKGSQKRTMYQRSDSLQALLQETNMNSDLPDMGAIAA